MTDKTKNIFISHIHEDDAGLAKVKDLAAKNGLTIRDSSINSDKPNNAKDPEYIKNHILRPQIEWASTLVVYVTSDTKDSAWVNWEIEEANRLGKRIVGVWAQGENGCEIPEALEQYGDALVGWHGESIVDAILGNTNDWYSQDGTQRTVRPIKRYSC